MRKILPFLTKLVFFLIAILFLILFSCKIFKFQKACNLLGIFGNDISIGVSLDPSLYDEKNEIKIFELLENGNNFIVIKSPEKIDENMTYVLPDSAGGENFVLTWQDGNIMQWKDVTSLSGLRELIQLTIKDSYFYQGTQINNLIEEENNDINLQSEVVGILPLEHGGSGSSLDKPDGDRIMFWDESKGRVRWLEAGDNLEIDGDSLNSKTILSDSGTSYTGEIYTAGNGLYVSGSQVRLGGSLVQNTTISQGSYNVIYNLSGSGDFDVQDNGLSVLKVTDSGLISVGVVTPGAFLDIKGSGDSTASLRIRSGAQPTSPDSGDIYSDGSNIYFWNGSSWDDLTEVGSTGDTLPIGTEGQLLYNNDGVWQAFNGMFWDDGSSYLGLGTTDPQYKLDVVGTVKSDVTRTSSLFLSGTEITSTSSELNILHGVSSGLTSDELSILDGVVASASEINTLYGVNPTLTSSELNILDGALISTSELNVLYGVNTTLTSGELNILDGATVSTSELNILQGALVSTSELNLLVGRSGVLIDSNNISSYAVTPSNIGSYVVTAVIAGSGLSQISSGPGDVTLNIGAGNGIFLDADSISLEIATTGTFSSTSSFSGLELNSSGLSLLGGCSDDEVLAWDTDTDSWTCSSKLALGGVTGSGAGTTTEGRVTIWNGNSTITGSDSLWFESDTAELGIGTTNPLYTLHVVGSVMALDYFSGGGNFGASSSVSGLVFEDGLYISGDVTGFLTPSDIGVLGGVQGYNADTTILGQTIELGSSEITGVLPVGFGGTGSTSFNQNEILLGSGTGPFSTVSAGGDGQILVGVSGSGPEFVTLSGDASVSNSGIFTLSSTSVVSGTYGSSLYIPQIVVDEKGRLTSVSEIDIASSLLPVGSEGQMIYNNSGTWVAFDSLYWDDGSLSLGIGTTDPQHTLDVDGDISSTSVFTETFYLSGTQVEALASELNVLSGILASTSELNVLNGILASTSELNVLSGILVSTGELNLLAGRTGTLLDSINASSYVITSITAGSGLSISSTGPGAVTLEIGAGNGLALLDDSINVRLAGIETTTSKSSPSGLEITSSGLRMLGGCLNDEVLSWNGVSSTWECANPSTLGGAVSGSGISNQVAFWDGTSSLKGSNNLWFTGTRLGIGTSNPSYPLHVTGNGLINSVLISGSGIGVTGDSDLLTLASGSVTINGTLLSSGVLLNNSGDIGFGVTDPDLISLASGAVTINGSLTAGSINGTWIGSTITVPNGGTGATTLTDHGVLVGSGTGAITALSVGTDGQILVGANGADPVFRTLGGDIGSISASGTVALATISGLTPGTYGSGILIPVITVDSKGRIISASSAVITDTNTTYTASNGLTLSGTEIQLGGTLSKSTSIFASNFDLSFNLNGTGDFRIQDNGEDRFFVSDGGLIGIGITNPTAKLHTYTSLTSTTTVTNNYSEIQLVPSVANNTDYMDVTGIKSYVHVSSSSANDINRTSLYGGVFTALHGGLGDIRMVNGLSAYSTLNAGTATYGVFGISESTKVQGRGTNVYTPFMAGININDEIYSYTASSVLGSVTIGEVYGIYDVGGFAVYDTSTITIGDLYGFYTSRGIYKDAGATANVTNKYDLYLNEYNGGATITNNYGLYIEEKISGTNDFNIYSAGGRNYFGGSVGIGITSPGLYKLNVAGSFIATDYFSGDGTLGATSTVSGLVFKNGLYTSGTVTDTNTTYTAANGLTLSGTQITLGGTLAQSTSIVQGNYNMVYNLTGTGNFDIQNTGVSSLYVSGSNGNVGIGTTAPGYDLDVLGTIRAQNFLTSGGMPVNDILLEQEVRNLSITAMTGSLGLDMAQFVEKIPETTFKAGDVYDTSAITLTNGNILIVYRDTNDYGNFVIYDSAGNLVKSETTFYAGEINNYGISATTLSSGNILIAYDNDATGAFVIYDSAGNLVKSETTFDSGRVAFPSPISLTNGNVLIAYKDNSSLDEYGNFVIYDSAGNLVKSETTFNAGRTWSPTLANLVNGNVLIAYTDESDSSHGNFVIYDSAGNLVKTETTFNVGETQVYSLSSTTLTNGDVLITYAEKNSPYYSNFVIYDSAGNLMKSETTFKAGGAFNAYNASATALTNGNILIAYEDASNSYYGNFVIYDSDGNLIRSETTFNAGSTGNPSATTLTNGNTLIVYSDVGVGNFVIWGSSGASFANLVGIGTTNPQEKLDVVGGNIRTDSNLIAGGAVLGYGEGTGVTDRLGGSAKFMTGTGYLYFDRNNSQIMMNETTGDLSGHAFSDDLGWIDFGEDENPSGPVNVSLTTGSVTGMAYVISSGSYVDFTNYSSNVKVNLSTGVFSGYVWSQEAGWIDFTDTGVYFSNNTITTYASNQDLFINPDGNGATFFSGNVTIDGTAYANAFSSNSPLRLQTAGIDRIYVDDATGSVGIGTTNPTENLVVFGQQARMLLGSKSTKTMNYTNYNSWNISSLEIYNDGSGTSPASQVELTGITSGTNVQIGSLGWYNDQISPNKILAAISGFTDDTYDSGRLVFYTNDAGSIGERMRLNSTGYLGIGTTNPTNPLSVVGSMYVSVGTYGGFGVSTPGGSAGLTFYANDSAQARADIRRTTYGFDFALGTTTSAPNPRVTITDSGYLGIGITYPQSKIHAVGVSGVVQSGTYSSVYSTDIGVFENNSDSFINVIGASSGGKKSGIKLRSGTSTSSAIWQDNDSLSLNFASGGLWTPDATISSTGYFGIGTTAPAQKFHLIGRANIEDKETPYTDFSKSMLSVYNSSTMATYESIVAAISTDSGSSQEYFYVGARFDVSGSWVDNEFLLDTAGTGKADGSWTTPADFAEYFYSKDDSLQKGDIVALVKEASQDDGRVSMGEMKKGSVGDIPLGVISTKPGFVGALSRDVTDDAEKYEKDPHYKIVGLLGQVPAKVTLKQGEIINTRDPIGLSDIPRYGTKMTQRGTSVGYATQSTEHWNEQNCSLISNIDEIKWPEDETGTNNDKSCYRLADGTYVGKIMIYVNASWYDPSLAISDSGLLSIDFGTDSYELTDTVSGDKIKTVGAYDSLVSADIKSGNIETKELSIDGVNLDQYIQNILSEVGIDPVVESTESSSENTLGESDLLTQMQNLYNDFLELLSTLGMTSHKDELGNNYLSIDTDVKMSANLNVLGKTTTSDLTVTGNMQIGTIEVDTIINSINVLGASCYNPETGDQNEELCQSQTLFLQKSGSGNLDIFNGKLVIEPNGNMKLVGDLEVTGTVKSESVETDSVIIRESVTPNIELGSECKVGQMTWDQDYLYICTSENMWSRSKLELIPGQSVIQESVIPSTSEPSDELILSTSEPFNEVILSESEPSDLVNP